MKINWKVRIKNKLFWVAMIPAIGILISSVAAVFGITVDFTDMNTKLLAVVEALFAVLALIGVVIDPTTAGLSDSDQAMTYEEPKE